MALDAHGRGRTAGGVKPLRERCLTTSSLLRWRKCRSRAFLARTASENRTRCAGRPLFTTGFPYQKLNPASNLTFETPHAVAFISKNMPLCLRMPTMKFMPPLKSVSLKSNRPLSSVGSSVST